MPADPRPSAPPPSFPHAAPEPLPPRPAPTPARTLHLGAAIDRGGPCAVETYLQAARLAERGALDFVTLGESASPGGEDGGVPDVLGVLARLAAGTDRIGMLAAAPAGRGPGTAAEIAALDRASRGRSGWAITVPAGGGDSRVPGRTTEGEPASEAALGAAGPSAVGAVAAADAGAAAVRTWQAMGMSGACPPDCRPVVVLDATEPGARAEVAGVADIALVRAARPEAAGHARAELRALAEGAGRDPDRLLVLADLAVDLGGGELGAEPGGAPEPVADAARGPLFRGGPVDLADLVARWQRSGAVDGFRIRPVEPARDLERFVNGTVALLQHRGLFRTFHPGATLREHLGLHRPLRATRPARSAAGSGHAPAAEPGGTAHRPAPRTAEPPAGRAPVPTEPPLPSGTPASTEVAVPTEAPVAVPTETLVAVPTEAPVPVAVPDAVRVPAAAVLPVPAPRVAPDAAPDRYGRLAI